MADIQEHDLEKVESIEKITAWLQPTDYGEFRRHLAAQAPGTGLWLRQTREYRQWRDSKDCGTMWLKGVPGAGKSVIAASMVELLRAPQQFPVLFFFFREIVAANHTPRSLTKDWLAQLLPHSRVVQISLSLYLKEDVEENFSDDQLWSILLDGLSSVETAVCVIDALDEMESGNEIVLSRLNSLAGFRPENVKLLLTSRPKQYLQRALKNAHIVHVSLEKDLVERDIAAFVTYRLNQPDAKNLSDDQKTSLKGTICLKSQGLFLYARLFSDQILSDLEKSPSIEVETLAQGLPAGLEEMYSNILSKHRTSLNIGVSTQEFLLQCVINCARPLRLNELADALRYTLYKETPPADCKMLARHACGPLLQISEDETVQLIHHSFKEYMCDGRRKDRGSAVSFPVIGDKGEHKMLVMLCLSYLRSGLSHQTPDSEQSSMSQMCDQGEGNTYGSGDDKAEKNDGAKSLECKSFSFDYQRASLNYPWLHYAVTNWTYHASHYDVDDQDLFNMLEDFLDPNSKSYQIWLWLRWGNSKRKSPGQDSAHAIHIAAFGGLTEFARYLLAAGVDVDVPDADQQTALHKASYKGHSGVTALLLQQGADVNAKDHRGLTPIHEAAKKNRPFVVRLLLKAGAKIRTPKTNDEHASGGLPTKGVTPLEYACANGNTESVRAMIEFMTQADLDEALCLAIRHDRAETVQAVLAHAEPSPNATLKGRTALYFAAMNLQEGTIRELLARGADASLLSAEREPFYTRRKVDTTPRCTPIHALVASSKRHKLGQFRRVLWLLIESGADIEAKYTNGDTALLSIATSAASNAEEFDILKILIDCGAKTSAIDSSGKTVLARSLDYRANLTLLQALLEHDAKLGDLHDRAAVLGKIVSTNGHLRGGPTDEEELIECINLLLRYDAVCDLDVLKSAFENPLCHEAALRLLLSSSKISTADAGLLFHHIGLGVRDPNPVIELLVERGADIETRNSCGETPFLAKIRSNWDMAMILIEHGARWDVVDAAGQNALWLCPRKSPNQRFDKRWDRLVEMGLDAKQPRNDGNILLHSAARSFSGFDMDVADLGNLMDLGLDINHQNEQGSPPLHIRQEEGSGVGSIHAPSLLSILLSGKQKLHVNAQDKEGLTALHLAATYSDVEVARLLEAGADASLLSKEGENALHLACKQGESSIVGLLIEHSKNLIRARNIRGETPLHLGCASGRPESVYYLLREDKSVHLKDARGNTALHSCASFSGKKVWSGMDQDNPHAEQILRELIVSPNLDPDDGTAWASPLRICSEVDTVRVVDIAELLLDNGADPSATNLDGHSPLEVAILSGQLDMAELLLGNKSLDELAPGAKGKLVQLRQMTRRLRHPSLDLLDKEPDGNDLFSQPSKYLKILSVHDLRLMIHKWQKEPEIEKGPYSLVLVLASFGLTELMKIVGSVCKLYDDMEWIERHRNKEKLYAEKFQPPLQCACLYGKNSNMPMIQLLVDHCGVDVNAHHLEYEGYWALQGSKLISGRTALHCLAIGKCWWQIDAIRYLVGKGADINGRDSRGETPLHVASKGLRSAEGNLTVTEAFWSYHCLKLLLTLGANPNLINNNGYTCLNNASKEPEILRELLRGGADMNVGPRHPLFTALNAGNLDAINLLLDSGADVNGPDLSNTSRVDYRVKDQLRTPLFCAAMADSSQRAAEITKTLFARGADWKVKLNGKETLLHYVFENACYEAIQAFLAFPNMDYNLRDSTGRTVLHAACNWRDPLPGYGHRRWATKATLPAITLLDLAADVHAVEANGRTALHQILDSENMATNFTLLFLGRSEVRPLLCRKDSKGFAPLHFALRRFRIKACEFLLAEGSNLLDPDPHGRIALHYLSNGLAHDREGDDLLHDPNEDRYSKLEDEPFHFPNDSLELWQRYLDLGGDINAQDDKGNPPLFTYLASSMKSRYGEHLDDSCHIDAFPTLFSGADLFLRNLNGETALHVVAKRKPVADHGTGPDMQEKHDTKLFKLLIGKGLDPLIEDNQGRSALDVAVACGQKGIMGLYQQGKE